MKIRLILIICCLPMALLADEVDHPRLDDVSATVAAKLKETRQQFEDEIRSGPSGSAYGQLGMVYQAHEFDLPARQAYEVATRLAPSDARWPYYLGLIASNSGDFVTAQNWFQRSLDINPDYLPTRIRLVSAQISANQLDTALGLLNQMKASDPDSAIVHAELGRISLLNGDFQQAINDYQTALRLQPTANQLHYPLAQAYRSLQDMDAARRHLTLRGAQQVVYNDPLLNQMQWQSQSAAYYLSVGLAALRNGDSQSAVEFLAQAVDTAPDDADARIGYARALESQGDLDGALEQLEAVIEKDPGNATANLNKGVIYELKQRDDQAARAYQLAVDGRPDYFEARVLLANLQMRSGQYEQAEEHYEFALSVRPERHELMLYAASALQASGDCRGALDQVFELVKLQPENLDYLIAYTRITASCPQSSDLERSNATNAAFNIHRISNEFTIVETLAMVEAMRGRFEQAVEYQAQAVFLSLQTVNEAHSAWQKHQMGRYEQQLQADQPWPDDHVFRYPPRLTAAERVWQ